MRERFVLKLGGHVIFSEDGALKSNTLLSYAKLIRDFWASGKQVHVVVGGGPPARRLIGLLSEVGAGKALQDIIGIEVSRLNAKLLAYSLIGLGVRARYVEELSASLILEDEILVMGGLTPGQSTTTVAALLAELIKADKLVVATDVDGIYTSDPKLNPQAKKLDVVTPQELMEILRQKHEPGGYQLIDRTALEIIARSNIEVQVVNGLDPKNVEEALRGLSVGTTIKPSAAK